ncbi:hypothetical protein VTK26DRAFT_1788 [Humicola hyalothermophila]
MAPSRTRANAGHPLFVVFSGNRFIIHETDPPRARLLQPPVTTISARLLERLVASRFLRDVIPTHCIAHLRSLELTFPFYISTYRLREDSPVMRDWRETVGWLRDKVNGPTLTLRLVWVRILRYTESNYSMAKDTNESNRDDEAEMTLCQPLR